jgi:16S rRNA (guanine1207-N2)-methyltransferase
LANALDGEVVYLPTDVRERDLASVPVTEAPEASTFGTVLIPAPPDRDLLRRHLLLAANALEDGGLLVICGPNAEGGKSAIKDAEQLFGTPFWAGYREKHRMGMFRKGGLLSPAWTAQPGVQPGTWQEFTVDTPAGELPLVTQAGVFAGARLDAGTRLLLEHLSIPAGADVLDLGCGVGVIGFVASRLGAGSITMTDANLLAIQAAQHNADALGIPARVLASDVYAHLDDARFDLIVSNPPFHHGKQVDLSVANRIIAEAPARLHPGGSLLLVANAFLAYGKQMATVFDRVETIATTSQYHVLRGESS